LFGLGFFESLFADNFDCGYFAILKVLDFVASSESTLAEKLPFFEATDNCAIRFAGSFFDDLGFTGLSCLLFES
jgi:hypothetical protein